MKNRLSLKECTLFAMFGAVLYATTAVLAALPNIHLIGVIITALTIVYRKKALWPIYIFVMITGLLNGFAMWWIPYLYIWTVLWAVVMFIPEGSPAYLYIIACSLHGFLYGTLYAPCQAILYGYDLKTTIAWIVSGLPFDAIHGVSNFICGFLIEPLSKLLIKLNKRFEVLK